MLKRFLVFCFLACTAILNAQTPNCDAIYLKNGTVFRGDIVEQVPCTYYKIHTFDNNTLIIKSAEVERVTKEYDPAIINEAKLPLPLITYRTFGGFSLPRGGFESMPGACAKSGFLLGGGTTFNLDRQVGIDVLCIWAHNPGREKESVLARGSYDALMLLPGFRFTNSDPVNFYGYVTVNLGYSYTFGPDFKYGSLYPWQSATMKNSAVFSFSLGAGYKNTYEAGFIYLASGSVPVSGTTQAIDLLGFLVTYCF